MKQILQVISLRRLNTSKTLFMIGTLSFIFCSTTAIGAKKKISDNPSATQFDLSYWNLTLPTSS